MASVLLALGMVLPVAALQAQEGAGADGVAAAAPEAVGDPAALRQVAGILAYVGSDYAGAVDAAGQVINELEYREQFVLVDDALALAAEGGLSADDPVVAGLAVLPSLLEQRVHPDTILQRCRELQRVLAGDHGVVLVPRERPDPERGRELYVENRCGTCHGERGDAATVYSELLDPPPADFTDPERVAGVTPFRAFHAITVGVAGTAMAEHSHLTEADAWDLAFHVLALRHDEAAAGRGRDLLLASGWDGPATAGALAAATEDDLRARLAGHLPETAAQEDALAWLRAGAPYAAEPAADFPLARRLLAEGLAAARAGRPTEARRLFVAAYLDGFEPFEPGLRARDGALVAEIEAAMLALREGLGDGPGDTDALAARVSTLGTLLDRAGRTDGGRWAGFTGSLLIALREGLEMVLLVGALLALVRRRGAPQLVRSVHTGWLLAFPAGLATWWLLGEALGGLQRELAEGLVTLAAAGVLLCVTHWFLGQASARQVMGFLSEKVEGAVSRKGAAWTVGVLAFVAVYRELVEVVLFYKALLLPADAHVGMVLLGLVTGLVALAVVAWALKRAGQRLPLRSFMLGTSVLLALLALVLVGKGIRALQEADWIGATPLIDLRVDALGLFGTAQGLTAQGAVLLLLLASAAWSRRAARRTTPRPPAPPAAPTSTATATPASPSATSPATSAAPSTATPTSH